MHRDANLYISFIANLAPLQIYAKALDVSSHFAIGCICNRHFVPTVHHAKQTSLQPIHSITSS